MGRALSFGLIALVVLVALYLLLRLVARQQRHRAIGRAAEGALWQAHHYTDSFGDTVVVVRRTARLPSGDLHTYETKRVDKIIGGAPDWAERFQAATKEAENRAFTLNYPSIGE